MKIRRLRHSKYFPAGLTLSLGAFGLWLSLFGLPPFIGSISSDTSPASVTSAATETTEPVKPKHLPTPESVRGIYMSSWVAGTPSLRDGLVKLIDETELNTVVVDIKDYTGRISFITDNEILNNTGAPENRIADIRDFINVLHEKNIYVIGRISVFQDPFLTAKRPDLAVKRASDGAVWQDHKGAKWLDPAAREGWDYIVALSRESASLGFDELNFDYIRFPSDGNMKDISYPFFEKTELSKSESLKQFFAHLRDKLDDLEIPLSADLFGMTATNTDDLNIGQLLEDGLVYFDYVSPMVYPSHYPPGFLNFQNPAEHPYEVIKHSMDVAVSRAKVINQPINKIRPWLQDFNLGAPYTAEMIKKQKQATIDAGLNSWLLWNAGNKYTRGGLEVAI